MTIARAITIFLATCAIMLWVAAELSNNRDCYDPLSDTRFVCQEESNDN